MYWLPQLLKQHLPCSCWDMRTNTFTLRQLWQLWIHYVVFSPACVYMCRVMHFHLYEIRHIFSINAWHGNLTGEISLPSPKLFREPVKFPTAAQKQYQQQHISIPFFFNYYSVSWEPYGSVETQIFLGHLKNKAVFALTFHMLYLPCLCRLVSSGQKVSIDLC